MRILALALVLVGAVAFGVNIQPDMTRIKDIENKLIEITDVILNASLAGTRDIILEARHRIDKRNIFTDPQALWPNGQVPFEFDDNIPAFARVELMAAMQEIEMSTYSGGRPCIMYVPHTNENDYIHIAWTSATHGSTSIGRAGGRQDMTVNTAGGRGHDDNLNILLTAVGMIPEAMRSDRNNYLTIDIGNAVSTDPFRVLTGVGTSDFGQPFDYNSVVLDGPYQYAKDPAFPVTTAKQANQVMGQAITLSNGDVTLLQHAYHCAVDASNNIDLLGTIPFVCHFHTDLCSFIQDSTDNFDWAALTGPTQTQGTGPNADYSSGSGKFALAEARNHHGQMARIQTPDLQPGSYCLRANIHMFGADTGRLLVSANHTSGGVPISDLSGSLPLNSWYHIYLNINSKVVFNIQFAAFIGNGDVGDIALDDVIIYNGHCIEW